MPAGIVPESSCSRSFAYLVMNILMHWGVWRNLRGDIGARGSVLLTAITLNLIVLAAFASLKWQSDPLIVVIAFVGMTAVVLSARVFLALNPPPSEAVYGGHSSAHEEKHEPAS
ncbi:hypothetical protein [Roseovarius sp.]|uniref:hypothetical protein n=1 Tax=Roseovarius sp. TaxID=1486281 RepID=UPI003A97B75E